ncbi:MAG: class I SAM-dependent methyltransferase [Candidatus Eiseniibacteriota bacterium]
MKHDHHHRATSNPADPWEVSTGESEAFVRRAWNAWSADGGNSQDGSGGSRRRPRLLDVGAGAGRLAAALVRAGFDVAALEPEPETAAAARARGLEVLETDVTEWTRPAPETGETPFDCILFARSLHHIPDLERALTIVRDALKPGGLVVLEEFTHDEADEPTARWYFERFDAGVREGFLRPPDDEEPLTATGLARWRSVFDHDPPLHGGQTLLDALARIIAPPVLVERAPYLYRWFEERSLVPDPARVRSVLSEEKEAVAGGILRPVGLRAVAVRPA